MAICWFVIFLVLLFIEIMTVNLVSIWFVIGSACALLASLFTESVFIQIIVFVVTSIIALLVTKPLFKKLKVKDFVPTNSDRVIGKVGVVTKKISSNKVGEVKVLGATWSAVGSSDLEVGTKVLIKQIDGVKLIVEEEK